MILGGRSRGLSVRVPGGFHLILEAVSHLDGICGGDDLAVRTNVVEQQFGDRCHGRGDLDAERES